MKFTEEELEKIKKERMKQIDRWLDSEYGCSYTHLEELHNFVIEQDMKHQEEKDKEIETLQNDLDRANSKLKESIEIRLKAIEYIHWRLDNGEDMYITQMTELLEILKGKDKE